MGYLIGGAVLALLGLILWILKSKKEGKSLTLEMLETSRIKDVVENHEHISNSMGSGSFSNHVEIKGIAHSDSPLQSELKEEAVVYYCSTVVHEYEKLETKTDSDGKKSKEWVSHEDTVSENKRWADGFGVKDDTGFVAIDANKSQLHTEALFSKFEKGEPNPSNGLNLKIKGFSISLGGGNTNNGFRTIGYRYTEIGIRLGAKLYVVGDANDRNGSLQISQPKDKKDPFIVSVKSKDDLLGSLTGAAKGLKIGAFISFGLAAVLVVVGIINMVSK